MKNDGESQGLVAHPPNVIPDSSPFFGLITWTVEID